MDLRYILLLLGLVALSFQQVPAVTPLVGGQDEKVSPCTYRVISFDIPNTPGISFSLEFTSKFEAAFNVYLTKQQANAETDFVQLEQCGQARTCLTQVQGEKCKIEVVCGTVTGKWFVGVHHTAANNFDDAIFALNLTQEVVQITPNLPIRDDDDGELSYVGTFNIDPATNTNKFARYHFFSFDLPAPPVEGTSLKVKARSTEPTEQDITLFLNYGTPAFPNGNCFSARDIGVVEISPCYFQQGGKWFLTVMSPLDELRYELLVHLEKPVIINLALNEKKTYRLKAPTDAVYFKIPKLTAPQDTQREIFVSILDNVVNGRATMYTGDTILPLLACEAAKSCTARQGCSINFQPCELPVSRRDAVWYIAVQAQELVDTKKFLEFSVSARMEVVPSIPLKEPTVVGEIRNGQHSSYTIQSSPHPEEWAYVHIYVSDKHNFLSHGRLYLSQAPFIQAHGTEVNTACSNYLDFCEISSDSQYNIKSCSIQIDPCRFNQFPTLYLTVHSLSSPDYYWYQETLQYTISIERRDPKQKPYQLGDGSLIADAVAAGKHHVYWVPSFLGSVLVTLSSAHQQEVPVYDGNPLNPSTTSTTTTTTTSTTTTTTTSTTSTTSTTASTSATTGPEATTTATGTTDATTGTTVTGTTASASTTGIPITTAIPTTSINDVCELLTEATCVAAGIGCGYCAPSTTCIDCNDADAVAVCPEAVQGCAKKRSLEQATPRFSNVPELKLALIYTGGAIGPSCPCFQYDRQADVPTTTHFVVLSETACNEKAADGFYIIVEGLADPAVDPEYYHYTENQYVLTVKFQDNNDLYTITPLKDGKSHMVNSQIDVVGTEGHYRFYKLDFPRYSLTSKALVAHINTHTPDNIQFGATLMLSAPNSDFNCNGAYEDYHQCSSLDRLEAGHCSIVLQCGFKSNNDNRDVHLYIDFKLATQLNRFSVYYELIDQTPLVITPGTPMTGVLRTGLYQHFTLNVPASAIGAQSIRVEVYFDQGHAHYALKPVTLYVHSPGSDRWAGDPNDGCYCFENSYSSEQKIVFHVNPCDVEAGLWRFSLKTTQPLYEDFPLSYTLISSLESNYYKDFKFEMPIDMRGYVGAQSYMIMTPPATMFDAESTDKDLVLRLTTTRAGDRAQLAVTTVNPATCACKAPEFSCTSDGASYCELALDYCVLSNVPYYLIVTPISSTDPFQPVPFHVHAIKENDHLEIVNLPVGACDSRSNIKHKINAGEYRHYKMGLPPALTGQEVFQIHVTNLTDGSVAVNFNTGKLATDQCNVGGGNTICPEGPESDCIVPRSCLTTTTYVSLKATSNNKNEPVSFYLSACSTTISTITLDGPAKTKEVIAPGATNIYEFSMANLDLSQATALYMEATNPSAGATFTLALTRGKCKTCMAYSLSIPCTDAGCNAVVYACNLPINYNAAGESWFLQVTNNGADEMTADLHIISKKLPAPTQIAIDSDTTVEVPPHSWATYSWTIGAADVLNPKDGIQRAFAVITGNNPAATLADSFMYTSALSKCPTTTFTGHATGVAKTFSLGDCCVVAGTYIFAVYNRNPTDAATLQLSTYLDRDSTHTSAPWTGDSATATLAVPQTSTRHGNHFAQVSVIYPGIINVEGSFLVEVEGDDGGAQTSLYLNTGGPAGTTPCMGQILASPGFGSRYLYQNFACGAVIPPNQYWLGIENGGTTDLSYTVTMSNVLPKEVKMGVEFTATGKYDVVYNYYIDLPPIQNSYRNLRLTVTAVSNPVTAYINAGRAAGDPARSACLNNIATSSVTTATPWEFTVPSCNTPPGRYYVGIVPNTAGQTSEFKILVDTVDTLDPAPTVYTIGTTLTGESFTAGNNYYTFTTPATLSETSYIVFKFTEITPATTPVIGFTLDGSCTTYDHLICATRGSDLECSTILYPCELIANRVYYITVSGPVSFTYTMTSSINTGVLKTLETGVKSLSSIDIHELQFFKYTPPTYEIFDSISVESSTGNCGSVRVYLQKGYYPGPSCTTSTMTFGVESFTACDYMTADVSGSIHMTVRGIALGSKSLIPYGLVATVSPKHHVKYLQPNEIDTFYASRLPQPPPVCPVAPPELTLEQCCVPPAPLQPNYQLEKFLFVYHYEGAHYLENFNTIQISTSAYITSFTVVFSSAPKSCATPAHRRSFTQSERVTSTYTLDLTDNCELGLHEMRQLFIWLEDVVYRTTSSSPDRIPVATLTHKKHEYTIIPINPSQKVQYLKFTLVDKEKQFFVINSPDDHATNQLFYNRIEVIEVKGGDAALTQNWVTPPCNPTVCTDFGTCISSDAAPQCAQGLEGCQCTDSNPYCHVSRNVNDKVYYSLRAVANQGYVHVTGKLKITYYVVEQPIEAGCKLIQNGQMLHFSHQLNPGPEDLYYFNPRYLNGGGSIRMSVSDSHPASGDSCLETYACTASVGADCATLYRHDSKPHLSLYAAGTSRNHFYELVAEIRPTSPFPLVDNVPHISPEQIILDSGCVSTNATDRYKFVALGTKNYMFVSLKATAGTTVYVHRDHVTHAWGSHKCTTNAEGFCDIIIGCEGSYVAGTYYFHVSSTTHTITVSERSVKEVAFNLNQLASSTFSQFGEIVSFKITVGGENERWRKNLMMPWTSDIPLTWFVTRSKLGDPSCGVVGVTNRATASTVTIAECNIHATADTFYVNFFYDVSLNCRPGTVQINAFWQSLLVGETTGTSLANIEVHPSASSFVKVPIGDLASDDIIYVRLTNHRNGKVSHKVHKGNHKIQSNNYTYPCTYGCTKQLRPYVSWGDECFHCGKNMYDTVFLELTVVAPVTTFVSNAPSLVDATVEKLKWTLLTNIAGNHSLPGPERSYHFYSADIDTHTSAMRLEVVVSSGAVEVEVWAKQCGLRTNAENLWCFPGEPCVLSMRQQDNFGSYDLDHGDGSSLSSPFADRTGYRVTVSGSNSVYSIRLLSGNQVCTPVTAPFCSPVVKTFFGESQVQIRRDNYASSRYHRLENDFACSNVVGCACRKLSKRCQDLLKEYACKETFDSCASNGFGDLITYSHCTAIEKECGVTFTGAGHPELDCNHNYYPGGVLYIDDPKQGNDEGNPSATPDSSINKKGLLGWQIALIVIAVLIVLIAVIGVVAYCMTRSSTPNAYEMTD